MNKSLLIAVCDFTILSILSIATFGPLSKDQEQKKDLPQAQTSLQNELFDQLKVSIEEEQAKGEERDKTLEQQRLEEERIRQELALSAAEKEKLAMSLKTEQEHLLAQKKALEEQKRKAELQQKKLEQEQLKAKERQEALAKAQEEMRLKELALAKASQNLDQHKDLLARAKSEQEKLQALSEQQKLELQQKLKAQQEQSKLEQQKLQALSEQQKKELEANLKKQQRELENKLILQQSALKENLLSEAERQKMALEQKLLQEKLKSQEAQSALMKSLMEKDREQKALIAEVQQKDQQVALAQQEQKHLKEVLDITRQQMASDQKVSQAVAKIEDRIVEQKSVVSQALNQVAQNQQDLNQNLESIKKKSSHEIFQLARDRCIQWNVNTARKGLFGTSQPSKTFYALPVKWADGSIHLMSHYQQSPFSWDGLDGDLHKLEAQSNSEAWSAQMLQVAKDYPELLFSDALPKDTLCLSANPEPQRSEKIVIVDLEKNAYAGFPLRWHPTIKNRILIEAPLVGQVFGPLSLQPGQLIFGDDGRWIGFVLEGKEGLAVGNLKAQESFGLADLEQWRKETERREKWIREIDPRRRATK